MWWSRKLHNYYCKKCNKLIEVRYSDDDLKSTFTVAIITPWHRSLDGAFSIHSDTFYYCEKCYEEATKDV